MITNQEFIEKFITTNDGEVVPYLWSHGATKFHKLSHSYILLQFS